MADCLCKQAKSSVTKLLLVILAPPPGIVKRKFPTGCRNEEPLRNNSYILHHFVTVHYAGKAFLRTGYCLTTSCLSRNRDGGAEMSFVTADDESRSALRSISKA